MKKKDFVSISLSHVTRFFKVMGKILAGIVGTAGILSVILAIYGPQRIKDVLYAIIDDFLTLKAIFQVSFTLALVIVVFAAIFCAMYAYKTYHSLSRECEKNDRHLKKIQNLLEQEKNLGILAINPRKSNKYSNDAYKVIFSRTNDELIISGHSLNKTINKKTSADLRDEFISTIIRLLENKRVVKILLVKPFESKERNEKRIEFNDFVKELHEKLQVKNIQNETICKYLHIKEADFLPYYIVKNEEILYIAHYTFGEAMEGSYSNMYIFETESSFGYGKYCYDDFISYFDKAEYIVQYRNLFERGKNA